LSLEFKQKWLVGFSKKQKISKIGIFPFTETFVFAKIVRIENCLFSRHFHEYMKFVISTLHPLFIQQVEVSFDEDQLFKVVHGQG
jgi:hypothetical protein